MIINVWIEAEEWDDKWDVEDCNSDVIVTFDSLKKWVASFFTYKNIYSLTQKNQQTGENLNGLYFCSSDIILVQSIDRPTIEKVINHLLETNDFEIYFRRIK